MKYILLLFIICISVSDVYGQSTTWQRLYDTGHFDDNGKDLCEDGKGNFFIIGGFSTNLYIMKINAYGVKIWERSNFVQIGRGQAINSTGDGGCIITGDNDSAYTIKLDSSGNIVWWKNYLYGSIRGSDIVNTSDNGYIVCGEMINTYRDGFVYKINSSGNLIWFKIYPASFSTQLLNIIEAQDKSFISTGIYLYNQSDKLRAYILKIDSLGNFIWDKKYQLNNLQTVAGSVNVINDRLIVSGWTGELGYPYFIKTDMEGNINYTKIFIDTICSSKPKLKIINSNKYLLTYSLFSSPSFFSYFKLIITDSIGVILQQNELSLNGYMYFENVINLQNGDIVAVGSNQFDTTSNIDIYVARTDSLLNTTPIGIKKTSSLVSAKFLLFQNYPNPFNPTTTIKYYLPKAGLIEFRIYDLQGKEIFYYSGYKHIGEYEYVFDASNLSSGVYFYQLKMDDIVISKKLLMLK